MSAYPTYSDEYLLALLKDNDESAFNEIYERYWETLLGMAYNRLKQLQEAEDVVHDVLAGLWKKRTTDISMLRAYLAASLKYNILRKAQRKELFTHFHSQTLVAAETMLSAERQYDNREMIRLLQLQIAQLPEKCRVIFMLSRFEGFSNSEIAEQLRISGKTVENQINKAQGRLRLSMKDLLSLLPGLFW